MNEGDPKPPSPYEDDSWKLYYRTIRSRRKSKSTSGIQDSGGYLPSPEEIEQRCADVRWLVEEGFSQEFIRRVMCFDNPTIFTVVHLRIVKEFSVEEIESGKRRRKPDK